MDGSEVRKENRGRRRSKLLRQPSDRNFIGIPVKLLYKEQGVLGLVLGAGFRRT